MRMSRIYLAAAAIGLLATPAFSLGIGDLAGVVLNNSSVLKKGEEKCGSSLALTSKESLAVSAAKKAAKKALSLDKYTALEAVAGVEADKASTSSTFCADTAVKKPSLIKSISKAGKDLLKAKILGGL